MRLRGKCAPNATPKGWLTKPDASSARYKCPGFRAHHPNRKSSCHLSRLAGRTLHTSYVRGASRRGAGNTAQARACRAHQTLQGKRPCERTEKTCRERERVAERL